MLLASSVLLSAFPTGERTCSLLGTVLVVRDCSVRVSVSGRRTGLCREVRRCLVGRRRIALTIPTRSDTTAHGAPVAAPVRLIGDGRRGRYRAVRVSRGVGADSGTWARWSIHDVMVENSGAAD